MLDSLPWIALALVAVWILLVEAASAMVLVGATRLPHSEATDALARRAHLSRVRFYASSLDGATLASSGDVLCWRIVVIDWAALEQLTPDELEALLAHELGHLFHNHPLKKRLLTLFCWRALRPGSRTYEFFERQADAFALELLGMDAREELRERVDAEGATLQGGYR